MRSWFCVVLLQAWSAQEAPSPNRGGGAQQEGQAAGQHLPGPDGSGQQEGVAGGAGGQHQPGPVSTSQQAEHQKNQRDLNLKVPIASPKTRYIELETKCSVNFAASTLCIHMLMAAHCLLMGAANYTYNLMKC